MRSASMHHNPWYNWLTNSVLLGSNAQVVSVAALREEMKHTQCFIVGTTAFVPEFGWVPERLSER